MRNQQKVRRSHLMGIGLDNNDEHKRITQAESFSVVGGSQDTHDKMTETLIKTFEDLKRKHKTLEDTETNELSDIIQKNTPQ